MACSLRVKFQIISFKKEIKKYHFDKITIKKKQTASYISKCSLLNGHAHERVPQYTKQYNMKVLLNGFHLNDHTLGFQSQIKWLEPPCTT